MNTTYSTFCPHPITPQQLEEVVSTVMTDTRRGVLISAGEGPALKVTVSTQCSEVFQELRQNFAGVGMPCASSSQG